MRQRTLSSSVFSASEDDQGLSSASEDYNSRDVSFTSNENSFDVLSLTSSDTSSVSAASSTSKWSFFSVANLTRVASVDDNTLKSISEEGSNNEESSEDDDMTATPLADRFETIFYSDDDSTIGENKTKLAKSKRKLLSIFGVAALSRRKQVYPEDGLNALDPASKQENSSEEERNSDAKAQPWWMFGLSAASHHDNATDREAGAKTVASSSNQEESNEEGENSNAKEQPWWMFGLSAPSRNDYRTDEEQPEIPITAPSVITMSSGIEQTRRIEQKKKMASWVIPMIVFFLVALVLIIVGVFLSLPSQSTPSDSLKLNETYSSNSTLSPTPNRLPSPSPINVIQPRPTLVINKKPTPAPSTVESTLVTTKPTPTSSTAKPTTYPTTSPTKCTACSDNPNDFMQGQDEKCSPNHIMMGTKCNKNEVWTVMRYCQASCYTAGYGYEGDFCCPVSYSPTTLSPTTLSPTTTTPTRAPTARPQTKPDSFFEMEWIPSTIASPPRVPPPPNTLSPSSFPTEPRSYSRDACIECSDTPNFYMQDMGEECALDHLLIQRKCNRNDRWREYKFCQATCYHSGFGYEGDLCC